MKRLPKRILTVLAILSMGLLPAANIDCDFEDGEFEFDVDGYRYDDRHHDRGGFFDFFFYEEEYYDPWDCCW